MRICFLLNPTANSGRCAALAEQIRACRFPEGVRWTLWETRAPREAVQQAQEAAQTNDIVVAIGGDGTIREVAEGLWQAKKGILGIIPAGTGNDLVRTLGWTPEFAPSMDRLFSDKVRFLDAGRADGQFFLNAASIGFDAHVLALFDRIKKRVRSKAAYSLALVEALVRYRDLSIRGAEANEEKLFLLAVGNGRYYGGGFQILPQACMEDGALDVCRIANIRRSTVLRLLPSIFSASHGKYERYVHMARVTQWTEEITQPFALNLDGELFPYAKGKRVRFEVLPKALQIVG